MNETNQRCLLWVGIVLASFYFLGFALLMGFFPPPSPSLSAEAVAHLYADANMQFRCGVILQLLSSGFLLPWTVVFSIQIAREEVGVPIWAISQGLAGAVGTMLFALPPIFWAAACFSPERAPALTQLMHELAFLTFIAPAGVFPLQVLPIGIIAFCKKTSEQLTAFPRWLGYLTFWFALSAACGTLAVLIKTGPFAWNGLFPFYIPIVFFSGWLGAIFFTILRSLRIQQEQHVIYVKGNRNQ